MVTTAFSAGNDMSLPIVRTRNSLRRAPSSSLESQGQVTFQLLVVRSLKDARSRGSGVVLRNHAPTMVVVVKVPYPLTVAPEATIQTLVEGQRIYVHLNVSTVA